MIKVLKAGFFTSVQDLGRVGSREFGVPVSGAMDLLSAQFSNALLGNNLYEAVLEITLSGPVLQFDTPTSICISGADMSPRLNDKPLQLNHIIPVVKGSVLSFGKIKYGYRSYLAVSGGFQTDIVLNSRSMYSNITAKSTISNDDALGILPIAQPSNAFSSLKFNPGIFNDNQLAAFEGPEFERLPKNLKDLLKSQKFTVSKNNNRMGYQLVEPVTNKLNSILTAPVLPGTVQLTPSGKLIILMRDGQTTGGYPRILQLKEEAMNILAQKKEGDKITFQF